MIIIAKTFDTLLKSEYAFRGILTLARKIYMLRLNPRIVAPAGMLALVLSACGAPAATTPDAQPSAVAEASSAAPSAAEASAAVEASVAAETSAAAEASDSADLDGIKAYLTEGTAELKTHTAALKQSADSYYDAAKAANFDYTALAGNADAVGAVVAAKNAWIAASPAYERMEGIVAGVPSLAEFDVILDAGSSAEDDPESAVPFDLTLPDGRVLAKPGNLFGIAESTLWGTRPEWKGADADLDGNGSVDFGEVLPEANVLKATADAMDRYAGELETAGQSWQPNEADAFTALVVMIPTMSEYFESWKQSRFVLGEQSTQSDFVVISRLADIGDILGGLEVVYSNVSPSVKAVDEAQDQQIGTGISDLKAFVADVYKQEQDGKKFTPEEADTLGGEAQARATSIAGQVSQVAARLNVEIAE